MKRRILSIITALALCLSLFTPALAASVVYNVDYLDANGDALICSSATEVTAEDTEWGIISTNDLWYVAKGDIDIDERVTIIGNVHLILASGCNLTVNGGIRVSADNSLTIYAQSTGDGMGKLSATAASNDDAAIGGSLTVSEDGYTLSDNGSCGTITINGGEVTATSTGSGAGIGGGRGAPSYGERPSGGTITINGGRVTATSKGGAGIGSGDNGSGGSVTINGGEVTATSSSGAGIGGGNYTDGGAITINGGTVTATGTSYGAGIGGGAHGAGGSVTISGGTVTATSTGGAGIGGGYQGGSGTFSTDEGGSAVIYAGSIADADDTSEWSGIIFQGNDGQVYGTPTLAEDVTIDKALTVGEGATLTIPEDVTLAVSEPLTNNGTIQINGTLSVTDLTDNGSLTGDGTLRINGAEDKLNQESAPGAPVVQSATANSVTLVVITGGAGAEYKCGDDGGWQESPVFDGLTQATPYTFYARYKESNFYHQSEQSEGTIAYTAAAAPDADDATIDYGAETIGFDDTYEMNTAKDFSGTVISSGGSLTEYIGQPLYIRVKEADGVPASAATAVDIPTRPGAPAVTATRDDYNVQNNGTISGVSEGMEYKLSTAKDWTDCAGDTITGLSVGTYLVRLKATDSAFSGTAAEVSILPSGTEFVDGLKTYNSDGITEQDTFAIDETIIAKAAPTATGEAPAMLADSLDAPGPGQMALFVGDTQVSGAVDPDENNVYTMSVSASDLSKAADRAEQITLTAKFTGTDSMADAQVTATVTVKGCTEHSYEYRITAGKVEEVPDSYWRFDSEVPTHTATCLACGYHEEQKHTIVPLSEIGLSREDYYSEDGHYFYCPDCYTFVHGEHIYDKTDPTGSCIVCGLGPIALVEQDGKLVAVVDLFHLEDLFKEANGAVVTLQRDAEAESAVAAWTPDNSTCTLNFAGHTLGGVGVDVRYGSRLTIQDSDSGGGLTGKLYVSGNAQITGGSFYNPSGEAIQTVLAVLDISGDITAEGTIGLDFDATRSDTSLTISGNPQIKGHSSDDPEVEVSGVGLRITSGGEKGTVKLEGGTYSGTEAAIEIVPNGTGTKPLHSLKDLLDEGYAFLNEDGDPIILTEGQTVLTGTVTVGECPHLYGSRHVLNSFKHNRVCQVCGHVADDEVCTYVWPEGQQDGACNACGDPLTVTVTGAENLTYNGQEHKPAVAVQHDGVTLTEGSDYTVAYENNVNAGIATVTVNSGKFNGDYVQSYGIAKAPPVVAWEDTTREVTYTGQPAVITAPAVTLVNGETFDGTNGTIHYSYAASGSTSYTPGLPTNAGSYTVKASVDEQGNYTAAETETPLTLTIEKADAQILTAPVPAQGLVYNKTAQALISAGEASFGAVVYALSENGPYSAEIPTGTNAGAYSVWYKVEGTDNYNGVAPVKVDVTIAKADYTGTKTANTSAKYGTTRTYALTALLQDIDGAALGTATTSDGIFDGTPTVSGKALSYTLRADAAPDSTGAVTIPVTSTNYKDFNLTITVTVTDKDVPELTVTEITVTYSGGPVPASAIKGTATVDGKAVSGTWSFAEGQAVTNVADSGVKAVKFTPNDTSEYAEAECTVKVTINKATPSGAPKYTAISASGKTLADAGLTTEGGTFSVLGTVAWELADSTEVTANTSYQWIFTPDDADNYNTLSGSVVLWQRSTGGGGGGGYVPSTPSTGSNLPVSTGTAQGSTVTTAAPTASTQGNTAVAKVDTAMGQEIVKQAKANNSESVVIAPKITGSVTRTEVSLPASTVGQIGNQTNASLTISTPVAGVTIPNGGLGSLSSSGGTVTVSAEMQGSTVELSVTANGRTVEHIPGGVTLTVPMANTTPGTVAVLVHPDGTQETVRKSVAHNGSVTIPLDGSAKLVIVDNSKQFSDVPATSWAADAIAFASAHELFNGTGGGMFSPDAAMSRGMLAVVLHNLENNPNQPLTGIFADVDNSQWYAEGIAWAAANGIVGGYGNGQFGPNDPITREQLAVMLWRYAGSPAATKKELHFTDSDEISDYALNALRWAVENGILNGYGDGRLGPKGQATRAQVAQMLKNFLER